MARRNYFDSDPSVALANAQQARGITSLDGWLRAQQQLIGLGNRVGTQRLDRQQGLERENILNGLVGNGLGRSGDVGYLQGQSALNFADKRYDQSAGFLSSLSDLMGKYLQQKQGLRDKTTGAYTDAFDAAGQTPVPGYVPSPGGPAAPHSKPRTVSPYKYGGGTAPVAPVYKPIPSPRGTY